MTSGLGYRQWAAAPFPEATKKQLLETPVAIVFDRGPMPGIPGAGSQKSSPNPKFICNLCANRSHPSLWDLGRMSPLSNFCIFLRPHIMVTSAPSVSIPTGSQCQLSLSPHSFSAASRFGTQSPSLNFPSSFPWHTHVHILCTVVLLRI